MIRVLWFEHSLPGRYMDVGKVQNGWTDSLERIVQKMSDIQLGVAFDATDISQKNKDVDGILYYPIQINYSIFDRIVSKFSYSVYRNKLIFECSKIINTYKPDIIQVFGTEFPYAQVSKFIDIPIVIHILGAVIPYVNSYYPPGVSHVGNYFSVPFWNVKRMISHFLGNWKMKSWAKIEKETWGMVSYYMGRTNWDRRLSEVLHPGRHYYCVNEALRKDFFETNHKWNYPSGGKLRLITTGCGTYWKGPDMLLKVAQILTNLDVDFEWILCGKMPDSIKREFEKRYNTTYEENHVQFVGFVNAEKLIELLCSSSVYIHTAYIENSPNSICEAQLLGVPIVSTNVGGISSFVRDGIDGYLVPANDPWQMVGAIMDLCRDKNKLNDMSKKSRSLALDRHSDDNIGTQLFSAYMQIIKEWETRAL